MTVAGFRSTGAGAERAGAEGARWPRVTASRARPREQRDLTVPEGTPRTAAAWSTDIPSRSTRTIAVRCSTGSRASARPTSRTVSRSASRSRGSAGSCSGSGTVGRAARRRTRSRQALTTMRCSQVVTRASPRKDPAARYADRHASWTASAASSGSPRVRSATAHSRWRCCRTSASKASGSPATWAASRARSRSSLASPSSTAAGYRARAGWEGVSGPGRRAGRLSRRCWRRCWRRRRVGSASGRFGVVSGSGSGRRARQDRTNRSSDTPTW